MTENQEIQLVKRPEAMPTEEHIQRVETEMPVPGENEVLLKTLYVSVDPYMRGRMSNAKSYVEPFALHEAINGGVIAQVVESNADRLAPGDVVTGTLPWAKYSTAPADGLRKIDPDLGPVTTSLGVLGMPGLTAYFGLTDIGRPEKGETVVVSAAAGAVGSVVVQIAKIYGAHVVGIAGSEEKNRYLTEELGVDKAINYKSDHFREALAEACPNGVDVYFDNVGGEVSDAVYPLLNDFARIPQCGSIATYNDPDAQGPRLQMYIVKSRALVKGFIVSDYQSRFKEGFSKLAEWVESGKLSYKETIKEGFEQIPEAFFGLFTGENIGKQLVRIAEKA
ncbi:NADP-dependent oxidoreductase [Virgibacillus senegalensis]|uniref:NADP-dependent oxidoreductase n=1 Tax=Virgibacillus senegalensis TaxID=1499679 RepID=UPI00069F8C47|nr:NADP-dependent oxidoreductase [Virgibacillus senegalensis]